MLVLAFTSGSCFVRRRRISPTGDLRGGLERPAMELSAFLEKIRDEGEVLSEGQFTMRLSEARRKLQSFQLEDPHAYILLMFSALVARGATGVEFRYGRGWLNIRADAEPWDLEEMSHLYSSFFRGDTEVGSTDLALGLNSALALNPKRLVLESRRVEEKVSWDLIADRVVRELPHRQTGVVIRIERTSGFLAWLQTLRGYVGLPPELRLVDRDCEYAPVPVTIDFENINRPVFLGEAPAVLRLGKIRANYQSVFVFRREPVGLDAALALGQGEIEWVVDGISAGKLDGRGLRGVVITQRLRRDLSRRAVVQDEAFEEVMYELAGFRDLMVNQLCLELEGILEELLPPYLSAIESAVKNGSPLKPESEQALRACYERYPDLKIISARR